MARLLRIDARDGSVVLAVEGLGRESAELLVLDDDGALAARLPMDRVASGFERILAERDVPAPPRSYRVEFGAVDDHVPVARARNDLHITDPSTVPLPLVLAEATDHEAARVRFGASGRLRVVRLAIEDAET